MYPLLRAGLHNYLHVLGTFPRNSPTPGWRLMATALPSQVPPSRRNSEAPLLLPTGASMLIG